MAFVNATLQVMRRDLTEQNTEQVPRVCVAVGHKTARCTRLSSLQKRSQIANAAKVSKRYKNIVCGDFGRADVALT